MTTARVLVVDDDDSACQALEKLLKKEGFLTATARDGESALGEAQRAPPDLVLTKLPLPVRGVELCRRFHELDPELPVIVMLEHSDMPLALDSLQEGAEDYLVKPLEQEAALFCIRRALARHANESTRNQLYRALNERLVLSSVREQEHAEDEVQQRVQLNMLLENLSEGVVIGDPSGRVLLLNGAARVIFDRHDLDLSTLQGDPLDACDLDGRPLEPARRPLVRATRGEQFVDYELFLVRPSGERRCVVFTGTSVRDEGGNVALAIVVFRDITSVRRLEQQRDEYWELISHDLRNPLNTLMLCVSSLKALAKRGTSSDVDLVELVARNAKRMSAMLEELTEAAGLESQGIALQQKACDLRELVTSVIEGMDDTRARRITLETDDALPYVVLGDASRLERVFANLLTNALKYSPDDAPVSVRLARQGTMIELDVVDRGIGIAPESVRMLFDRYYRATGGKAWASGLGLGLYIARLIIEAHGGRIDVSSEVGQGSRFRLLLPSHEHL